ncbi:MAG: endonuclease/exonuclease/phosphatase family protein [Planctomycetota bacterium]|nr:endonuclease/exonuclease/phosphatase family protein [Planctomycetota bacterium]
MKSQRRAVVGLVYLALLGVAGAQPQQYEYVRNAGPETFTYDELRALGNDQLSPDLAEKLRALTKTPFVSNEAFLSGTKPHAPEEPGLGRVMRVVLWNIERGVELDAIKLLLNEGDAFVNRYLRARVGTAAAEGDKPRSVDRDRLLDDVKALQRADVLVLNEVDWGIKRSGYRAVVRELAETLKMNWAYGVEFLEIDPGQLGTEAFAGVEDDAERRRLVKETSVDHRRSLNMHGTAILSRYPIRAAELKPLAHQPYDWFEDERDLSGVEKKKRQVAKRLGLESLVRQIRRGGRTTLSVTLDVPELPEGQVTVVSPHLENRADPKDRRLQMLEVLRDVQQIRHPVIIAGDLNTTMTSGDVTTVQKLLFAKYGTTKFWVNKGVKYATGLGLVYSGLKFGFRSARLQSDPTAQGIKWVASNEERRLFEEVERFRFVDGSTFDFRGDSQRTINGLSGTLANSNQRASRGYTPTFSLGIAAGPIGKYKLDWFFVKDYIEDPRDSSQSYRFAPHRARTMRDVNYALARPLSDHAPMSIDLPFEEPSELPAPRWPEAEAGADLTESWDHNRYQCRQLIDVQQDPTHRERVVWLYGYYSAKRGAKFDRLVGEEQGQSFVDALHQLCALAPNQNLLAAVTEQARATQAGQPAESAQAEWDLRQFTGGELVKALEADEENLDAALIWLHGFYSAGAPKALEQPVTPGRVVEFIERVVQAASREPERPLLDLTLELN